MIVLLYGCSFPLTIRASEGREEHFEMLGLVQIGVELEIDEVSECVERDFSFV
jgi:hypothetical protein